MRTAFLLLLFFIVHVMAQTPPQTPAPNPCADSDIRRAMAESRLAATEVRCEVKALLVEQGERALVAEQKTSQSLATSLERERMNIRELQDTIAEREVVITSLTEERNRLATKIRKANGATLCEWFHVGCIGER